MIPRSPRPAELLFPKASPFRMAPRIATGLADPGVQRFVPATTRLKDHTRETSLAAAFGARVHEARRLAGQIRNATLAALDHHLAAFVARATANGIHVHVAPDAAAARRIVLAIAAERDARKAVKAKSMVTEEVQLLDAMLAAGIDTIETDLGELVLQLDDDAPSHLVTPMIHKDRVAASHALARLDPTAALTTDPGTLTANARKALRKAFAAADIGITGANFLCVETGEIVLCTNEGNGRLSSLVGHTHIAVAGRVGLGVRPQTTIFMPNGQAQDCAVIRPMIRIVLALSDGWTGNQGMTASPQAMLGDEGGPTNQR